MGVGKRLMVNEKGYLCRTSNSKKEGVRYLRDWWIGKSSMKLSIAGLPSRYHGKHIKVKIEIVDEGVEEDERRCNSCNKRMSEGYCISGGEEYYCSDDCLHEKYTEEQWIELYDDGNSDSYWTTWEDEE